MLADNARLHALRSLDVIDHPAAEALDRVTRLATSILDAPVALLTLVDDRRQFFLSQQGLPEPWRTRRTMPLSHSFCRYVVVGRQALMIEDARSTRSTMHNLATEDLGVVAYLGVPLAERAGHVLGALCVIDHYPRQWDGRALEILTDLARIAMDELVLSRMLRRQAEVEATVQEAEERFRWLAADVSHRVNNAISIIGSVVRHSLRTAESLPQASRALEGRLQALVSTHELMNRDTQVQTRLLAVVNAVLSQFGRAAKAISLNGDDLVLPSRLALLFALTVHELASNAIRHGSLLSPLGQVRVRWKLRTSRDGSRQIVFLWLEEGGPVVLRPQRVGFGTMLIRRLAQAQNAVIRVDHRPLGLRCLLQAPLVERTMATF